MKVSINWLQELVNLNCSIEELVSLLPLRSISIKEVTDSYIELDMKGYNRADLLFLRGVAQEIAAITGSKLLFQDLEDSKFTWKHQNLPTTPVSIEEASLSQVQCVIKIENLSFGKSPSEWIKKLEDSGMRAVNNIVDVTNLVMLEYGQPLHSFDAQDIDDETIIVRRARGGEELVTLDGKKRVLSPDDLVLADTNKSLDVAGIMGSKDTEVTESTQTILLSASLFNPQMVMKTANKLGLHSEASKRFQHGLTKIRLLQALDGAIKMYESLGGKVVAVTLVGSFEDQKRVVKLTHKKLDELIGINISPDQVESYLKSLGFHPKGAPSNTWEVGVPYWRLDIELEEDLVEEVARMYGYEKIPAEKVAESKPLQDEDPIFKKTSALRQELVDLGLTEIQTYSFYSTPVIDALEVDRKDLVKVANPISSETEYLRQSIWPNLVEVVGKNLKKGAKDIAIFEIGKAFNMGEDGKPIETYKLAIALMNNSGNPLAELNQIASHLRGVMSERDQLGNSQHFHPNRHTGNLAEVHLKVLNRLGIDKQSLRSEDLKRVAVLEVELESNSNSN